MKVVSVFGARPQFIKAAMVHRALQAARDAQVVTVHTGQHYDEEMSDVFFSDLAIAAPDYHLGVGSLSHGAQTGRMLECVERVLLEVKPDWVLVYGDTNSTLAGALATAKLGIALAHVEAGLRSFRRAMPEEINRVLTDHIADLLLTPTQQAVVNLRNEGVPSHRVHRVGDVMYDAALHYGARATSASRVLEHLDLRPQGYVLATVHRAENTDEPSRLHAIIEGLALAARELPVVLPLHPRSRNALSHLSLPHAASAIRLTEPVGYLDMVMLEQNARLIATDSGGVQKEAFFYRVPCLTLREETEWVELVELGWNRLLPPTDARQVRDGIVALLAQVGRRDVPDGLYGDGRAAEKIVQLLAARAGS